MGWGLRARFKVEQYVCEVLRQKLEKQQLKVSVVVSWGVQRNREHAQAGGGLGLASVKGSR